MRKLFLGLLLVVLALGFGGVAVAGEYSELINHVSSSLLFDGKPFYDAANFNSINFTLEYERAYTQADNDLVGKFTIKNGTYRYPTGLLNTWAKVVDGKVDGVTVDPFDLRVGSDIADYTNYVDFNPVTNSSYISFYYEAEGGLQGKTFEWSLGADENTGTFPDFRTTEKQISSYAPYVELADSAIYIRAINPSSAATAIAAPYKGTYRITIRDKSDKRIYYGGKNNDGRRTSFEKGDEVENPISYPSGVTKADVGNVQVDLFLTEKEDASNYRYRWRFYNAGGVTESNAGIPSWGEKSDALKIGQEEEYEVEFGAGYYLPNNRVSPIIIADKSVVSVGQYLSFDYNTVKGVNVLKFTLKGLKNGTTTISLLYQDNNGTYYTTAPVSLKVSNGSSSGGGCDVGFGAAVLLLAAGLAFRSGLFMRKLFMGLSLAVLALGMFSPLAFAEDDPQLHFDLTRIFYKDALKTVNYDFSEGTPNNIYQSFPDLYTLKLDEDSFSNKFITYNERANDNSHRIGLEFQYNKVEGHPTTIIFEGGKAAYSFKKPSIETAGTGAHVTEGYPLNLATSNHKPALAKNDWFYSMRMENFRGFDSNLDSEFKIEMFSHFDTTKPDLRLSLISRWIDGLYRGEAFRGKLVLSALFESGGNAVWESEVGGEGDKAAVAVSAKPEEAILDAGIKVEKNSEGDGSVIKLYYRLNQAGKSMEYDDASWTLFHTIPIDYAFPGIPMTEGNVRLRSEAIGFLPALDGGEGTFASRETEPIDKDGLAEAGIDGEPIASQQDFTIEGISEGDTQIIYYKIATESRSKPNRNQNIKLASSDVYKTDVNPQSDRKKFTYSESKTLTDGQWNIRDSSGDALPLAENQWNPNSGEEYFVYLAIKDGGEFDQDKERNGKVKDPHILVISESDGGNSDGPGSTSTGKKSSGGCDAGLGVAALLLAAGFAIRNRA